MTTESTKTSTGFKDSNEFCLHLEQLKKTHNFDSYIDTIVWYVENETDIDIEDAAKFLNKKILDAIQYEATMRNMITDQSDRDLVSLF